MFIRKRQVKGPNDAIYTYYAIVETHRINGKPRQKLLYNMGKRATITECIEKEQKDLEFFQRPDIARMSGGQTARRIQARIEWLRAVVFKVASCDFEHYTVIEAE